MSWTNFTVNSDGKVKLKDLDFRGVDDTTRVNLQIIKSAIEEIAQKIEDNP